MKINIYRIIDPETRRTVYIGATKFSVSARLAQHLNSPQSKKMTEWVRSLKSRPTAELIESVCYNEAHEREKFWIREYAKDCNLLNDMSPARYNPKGKKLTPLETKHMVASYLDEAQYTALMEAVKQNDTNISKYIETACREKLERDIH
jgi:hypothetical protein